MRVSVLVLGGVDAVKTALGGCGSVVDHLDVVDSHENDVVVEMTCSTIDYAHSERLREAVDAVDGAVVLSMGDRTFLLHRGGAIGVEPITPLRTQEDLSMAYTPGVARISLAIAEDPLRARDLTIKGNSVAVVTDGSAVLGLGNIGPAAALPVMEGKALLFKSFAGINAWPVCLATQDTDEIVAIVEAIAPVYGGINLEDISAPRCFEIEARLRESLDIPVFHDDQHGTAVVVFAALSNALEVVGKSLGEVRVVVLGTGAAGVAIIKLLLEVGIGDVIGVNRGGILGKERRDLDEVRYWVAAHTNAEARQGGLEVAMAGADVVIGVSGANLLTEEHLKLMGPDSIVFALANPDPEVDPVLARRYAAIVATGRSDEPNQINNVLVFPGLFRGVLNSGAKQVTEEMKLNAGLALAGVVSKHELSPTYIIPTVFNPAVVEAVATAVERTAKGQPG
jgi:malate dehydrogenase (oxaloacetate-decarboxylating)